MNLIPRGHYYIKKSDLIEEQNSRQSLIHVKLYKKGFDTMIGLNGPIIKYIGALACTSVAIEFGASKTSQVLLAAWQKMYTDAAALL
jgi:hypothetical protein